MDTDVLGKCYAPWTKNGRGLLECEPTETKLLFEISLCANKDFFCWKPHSRN